MVDKIGTEGIDRLVGTLGNDFFQGLGGLDTLLGLNGSDIYLLLDATNSAYDIIDEGLFGGVDSVVVTAVIDQQTKQLISSYTLAENVENGTVGGVDTQLPSDAPFTLTGTFNGNALQGNRASNTLNGVGGNDFLNGGLGLDTLNGGSGDDTFVLLDANFNTHDIVVEAAGGGNDTVIVQFAISTQLIPQPIGPPIPIQTPIAFYALTANVENGTIGGADTQTGADIGFTLVGNSLDNVLTGNRAGNVLVGGEGKDTLNGGLGLDVLNGGKGDDVFVLGGFFSSGGALVYDTVNESAGEGNDTVIVTALAGAPEYSLAGNVENVTVSGDAGLTVNGNGLGNVMTGNGASNTLRGINGNDALNGGLGLDTLDGGSGDDTYILLDANFNQHDIVVEDPGNGVDTVIVQQAISIQLIPQPFGPPIQIPTPIAVYGLTANVENGTIGGVDTGTGADLVFTLVGNALNNVLTGNRASNVLVGADGNDTLNGAGGQDQLNGGLGDDTYLLFDQTSGSYDSILEVSSGGEDTVVVGLGSYILGSNIENGTAAGIDSGFGQDLSVNVTGNTLENVLTGNRGSNTLDGAGGNDILNGGLGLDTLKGGTGNDLYILLDANFNTHDIVVEAASGGIDTVVVQFAISTQTIPMPIGPPILIPTPIVAYALTANVENGTIGGVDTQTGADMFLNLIGNALGNILTGNRVGNALIGGEGDDTLIGGGGGDSLNGGIGKDTMLGGEGDDVYIVDDAGDIVDESAAGSTGTDTVRSSVRSISLGDPTHFKGSIEKAVLEGNLALDLGGNAFANYLQGNTAANNVSGGNGGDSLVGDAGSDKLYGGEGTDTLFGDGSPGGLSGVTLGTGVLVKPSGAGNNTVAKAINVTNLFSFANDPDIISPTTVAHVSVQGTGDANKDYYKVTVAAGTKLTFDIDRTSAGLDTVIVLYDADGKAIKINDDSLTTDGAGGSTRGLDSFLTFDVATAGTYTIEVGDIVTRTSNEPIKAGETYELQISVAGAPAIGSGSGNDYLDGGTGADKMFGGAGNDTYNIDSSGDIVDESVAGSSGSDTVRSSNLSINLGFTSVFIGSVESAVLEGANSLNLTGNALGNYLQGNNGANIINGGGGADTLVGLGGADTFRFANSLGSTNIDKITDYSVAQDRIELDNAYFTALVDGFLFGSAFVANTTGLSQDASDRIIYETDTGKLFYDSNGSAAGGVYQQFAQLSAGLTMTAGEFFVT